MVFKDEYELTANFLSIVIQLSGVGVVLLVSFVMLKYRDRTVRLPIDREQLIRIPALGLQNHIQDLQFDVVSALLVAVMVVCFPFAYFGVKAFLTIGSNNWILVTFIVIGLIYSGYRTWKAFSQLFKFRLGHTAELATANELKSRVRSRRFRISQATLITTNIPDSKTAIDMRLAANSVKFILEANERVYQWLEI